MNQKKQSETKFNHLPEPNKNHKKEQKGKGGRLGIIHLWLGNAEERIRYICSMTK